MITLYDDLIQLKFFFFFFIYIAEPYLIDVQEQTSMIFVQS